MVKYLLCCSETASSFLEHPDAGDDDDDDKIRQQRSVLTAATAAAGFPISPRGLSSRSFSSDPERGDGEEDGKDDGGEDGKGGGEEYGMAEFNADLAKQMPHYAHLLAPPPPTEPRRPSVLFYPRPGEEKTFAEASLTRIHKKCGTH